MRNEEITHQYDDDDEEREQTLYKFSFQNVQLIESGLKIKKLGYTVLSRTQNEKRFAQKKTEQRNITKSSHIG